MRLVRLKAARAQLEEKCVKALERHKQRDKLVPEIEIIITYRFKVILSPCVKRQWTLLFIDTHLF